MNDQKRNRRIFICPILPNNVIRKYGASFAANNFCSNLLSDTSIFDEVLVTLPIKPVNLADLVYSDRRIHPAFCKLLRSSSRLSRMAFLPEAWKMFKRIQRGDSVWYYNLAYTLSVLFVLLKIFKPSVRQHIIILDYTPDSDGIKGLMERFLLWLINQTDGAITLAPNPIFTCRPIKCLAGVVPNCERDKPMIMEPNNKYLLSGVLSERIAQLSMVLKVFSELPQCELHITGTIDNDSIILAYASRYPNIIYHGNLPFDKYFGVMHSCTFQLSTRDPESPENRCNFPSKIIESLLHNRIVISTIQYKQLNGINYFNVPSKEKSFAEGIKSISSLDEFSLLKYANQGRKVAEMFSTRVWNETLKEIEKGE